ncbi:hypothetical protein FUAX_07910 [Fulvitalea axinellae]|uniref:Carboxypeptidase regulatory-like domain-containing protein n=1 Tax=Fulvitalea axinellae TaxID=1182444 RepID=A0AAU9D1P1_9BACT|nr:hypothetical protein FUAX_07910 [Fulvitalea axinellae]
MKRIIFLTIALFVAFVAKAQMSENLYGAWYAKDSSAPSLYLSHDSLLYKGKLWRIKSRSIKVNNRRSWLVKASFTVVNGNKTANLKFELRSLDVCWIGTSKRSMLEYRRRVSEELQGFRIEDFHRLDTAVYSGWIRGFKDLPKAYQHRVVMSKGKSKHKKTEITENKIVVQDPYTGRVKSKKVTINDDGTFSVRVPVCAPQQVRLSLVTGTYWAFLEPGKTTFQVVDQGKNHFVGETADLNNQLAFHGKGFSSNTLKNKFSSFRATKELPKEFEARIQDSLKRTQVMLGITDIASPKVRRILESRINYYAYTALTRQRDYYRSRNRNTIAPLPKIPKSLLEDKMAILGGAAFYGFVDYAGRVLSPKERNISNPELITWLDKHGKLKLEYKALKEALSDPKIMQLTDSLMGLVEKHSKTIFDLTLKHRESIAELMAKKGGARPDLDAIFDKVSENPENLTDKEKAMLAEFKPLLSEERKQFMSEFTKKFGKKQEAFLLEYKEEKEALATEYKLRGVADRLGELLPEDQKTPAAQILMASLIAPMGNLPSYLDSDSVIEKYITSPELRIHLRKIFQARDRLRKLPN